MKIGILATGRMARGLAQAYIQQGHDVTLGSRNAQRAQQVAAEIDDRIRSGTHKQAADESELLVLAVPFADAAGTIRPLADVVAGKIVVDITNPFGLVPPGQLAGVEHNAQSAPKARWVAAYKTTFWKTLNQPLSAGGQTRDVFVCANDRAAKLTVMQLIEQTGFRPVDCGGLSNAGVLDLMVPLMIELDRRHDCDSLSSWQFLHEA